MWAASAEARDSLPVDGGTKNRSKRASGQPAVGVSENLLFAGTSALLLLIANLFPHFWYVSFFALIPFLYRSLRVDRKNSFWLGLIFGFSFFAVLQLDAFLEEPVSAALTVALGTALFALFGWGVATARDRFGFNPLLVSLLWILFELLLVKVAGPIVNFGTIFQLQPSGFFHGLSILFGCLAVSFVIVLVNSLFVFAVKKAVPLMRAREQGVREKESVWDLTPIPGLFAQNVYIVPAGRAPPLSL